MRQLQMGSLLMLLSLFLLCTCSAVRAHRRLQGPSTPLALNFELADTGPPVPVKAQTCSGVVGRDCTYMCQLRTCKALVDIYRASNNVSDPWDQEHGWEQTGNKTCQQLLEAADRDRRQEAPYCSWHGVTCCTAQHAASGRCWLVNSVSAINQAMNNINVSLENPVLFKALKTLHDCGMFMLNFESNNVAGRMTEEWGQLEHMRYINIGTCWVHGTIPQGIKKMQNLTVFHVGNNWFSGTMPNWLPGLKHMRVLNLGSQYGGNEGTDRLGITGTIPTRIGELQYLRELVLEANSLTGTLPEALCHNSSSLLLLNVHGNRLQGSAREVEECSRLVQLDISHNEFTGSLPASSKWQQLATYTASHNRFSGSWPPALTDARILAYLDLSHNSLTGLLPPKVTLMSSLTSVKLSNNMFSGTVVEDLYFLPALSVLDLSSNQFVGTTPAAIGLSYNLAELDLSNNTGVTGLLPAQLGLLPQLQVVKMLQTNLSCAGITKPYIVTTNYSCSDPRLCRTPQQFGDPSQPERRCVTDELLPCFLRFSDHHLPRKGDMRCKDIVRKQTEQARRDCAGSGNQQLGGLASTIPHMSTDRWMARWEVDPAYYQYQVCECLLGFSAVWDASGTVLTCVEQQKHAQHKSVIVAVAVAVAAVLAVALIVWRQYLRTRPRWLRERVLQAKRSKGAPKAAKPGDRVLVTILVTDVQDFSDLTRRYPELMNKAMGGHNNIMRKACHAHAGHVMDQEGDSWTIAFHDAEDAVAFGLQVQQALRESVWSLRMTSASSSDHTTRAHHGSQITQTSELSVTSSYGFIGSGTATPPLSAGGLQDSSMTGAVGRLHGSFTAASSDRGSSVTGMQECSFTAGAGQHGDVEVGAAGPGLLRPLLQQQQQPVNRLAFQVDATRFSKDAATQQLQQQYETLSPRHQGKDAARNSHGQHKPLPNDSHDRPVSPFTELHYSHSTQRSGSGTTGQSSRPTSRLYSAGSALISRLSRVVRGSLSGSRLLHQHAPDVDDVQELRLSVRIGIATGWLVYGCSLEDSAVTERAKNFVSDVANGGQVLLDEHTFRLIKHSLSALGTVDEHGYNDKQLQQLLHARVMARMQRVACAANCCSRKSRTASFTSSTPDDLPRDYDTDAVVLHMGGFTAPAVSQQPAAGNSNRPQHLTSTSDDSPSAEDDDACEEPPPAGAVGFQSSLLAKRGKWRAAMDVRGNQRVMQLQLYLIAAPKMRWLPQHTSELQSCTSWCQPVRAKLGWQQVQKDYFAAPGAHHGDLAPSSQQELGSSRPPLPAVTFVFAEVPGVHRLSVTQKHHKSQLHAMNKAIRRCMLQQMADLPGGDGYMCRCHEPDMKYMVAFESPVRAVQWCLLVQEALMYVDWPQCILELPGFQEQVDPVSGQLLFKGPRLRMGVSEGIPSSVLPDHMGHANYCGGAVNRAARFMDAAAQPGQVVCDLHFAKRCFEAWAHMGAAPLPGRQSWGSGLDCISPESIPESAAATDWGDPQISLMQLVALRSQSETSGHCRPATGPQGLRSRALHELWYQQQQPKQDQKVLYRRQMKQQQQFVREQLENGSSSATAAPAAGGSSASGARPAAGSSGRGTRHVPRPGGGKAAGSGHADHAVQHASGCSFTSGNAGDRGSGSSLARYNPLIMGGSVGGLQGYSLAGARLPSQQGGGAGAGFASEPVTASCVGRFSFKGSGAFEMVQLQQAALLGRQFPQEVPKGGKGTRLSVASGQIDGLCKVQLPLPARLIAARDAFEGDSVGSSR